MSASFATKEATIAFLISLGFTQVECDNRFYDSPKGDEYMPVVQAYVYKCLHGYFCVTLDGDYGWSSPVVWSGPTASWDSACTSEEFVSYLDKHYPGWR